MGPSDDLLEYWLETQRLMLLVEEPTLADLSKLGDYPIYTDEGFRIA